MNDEIKKTYKAADTEEWLDIVWTRPIGFLWARFFRRLHVHPNVVTILSIIIGVAAAFFFASPSFYYDGMHGLLLNIVAVLLLMWANFYDSADGQLARMTGQKTQLGRILDGAAGEIWFIAIYLALVYRFYHYHSIEFSLFGIADTPQNALIAAGIAFCVVLFSGFVCHSGQCALADYYRQIHLFFVKAEHGSEFDNSQRQQALYQSLSWSDDFMQKTFAWFYLGYTRKQERRTPQFQRLFATLRERYGDDLAAMPDSVRQAFRAKSLPLMKYTNILTFNTRAIALYITTLLDVPMLYFAFEIIVMSALYFYMRHRHETASKQLLESLNNQK